VDASSCHVPPASWLSADCPDCSVTMRVVPDKIAAFRSLHWIEAWLYRSHTVYVSDLRAGNLPALPGCQASSHHSLRSGRAVDTLLAHDPYSVIMSGCLLRVLESLLSFRAGSILSFPSDGPRTRAAELSRSGAHKPHYEASNSSVRAAGFLLASCADEAFSRADFASSRNPWRVGSGGDSCNPISSSGLNSEFHFC
jgi:hypothetical protein